MGQPSGKYAWEFRTRFRRRAFGWRSRTPVKRVREAVKEIKRVARRDPVLGAEGAVLFLEKVSPAIVQVDDSAGYLSTAVGRALDELVPIIAKAPADEPTRAAWLDRLQDALQEDEIPYIERLGDAWGELCVTPELASAWADQLLGVTRLALSPDPEVKGYYRGTGACLSALYHAGRYEELVDLLHDGLLWHHNRWKAKALAALGQTDAAIALAERCRDAWANHLDLDQVCEAILLEAGRTDEAYRRYALRARSGTTYRAIFRGVLARYPERAPEDVLADLVMRDPDAAGKWFAAAKDAKLYDAALVLARRSPCDPRTLARAARDFAGTQPRFAVESGLLALYWLCQGYGYEITGLDVLQAYTWTLDAAARAGCAAAVQERIRSLLAGDASAGGFVRGIIERRLDP